MEPESASQNQENWSAARGSSQVRYQGANMGVKSRNVPISQMPCR